MPLLQVSAVGSILTVGSTVCNYMWAELCFLFAAEDRLSSLPQISGIQAHFPPENPSLRSPSLQREGGC